MSNEPPAASPKPKGKSKKKRPTRKLSFASRMRERVRTTTDKLLGLDYLWSAIFVVTVVSLVGTHGCGTAVDNLEIGQPAPNDVRAQREANIIDVVATERRRREARDAVPVVYEHDDGRAALVEGQLASLFVFGRNTLSEVQTLEGADPRIEARNRLADTFEADVLEVLLAHDFDPAIERELKRALGQVMSGRKIVGNKLLLVREPQITVARVPTGTREIVGDYATIVDVAEARDLVRERVRLTLPPAERDVLRDFVASFADSNLNPDSEATERLRAERASEEPPVVTRIPAGTRLIEKGQVVTRDLLLRAEEVQQAVSDVPLWQRLVGVLLIASMSAFFLYRYTRYHQRRFKRVKQLHALLILVMLSMLGLSQVVMWLARLVAEGLTPVGMLAEQGFGQFDDWAYLAPLGAGSILITLLANGRIAMVYSGFTGLLFGGMLGWDPYLMVWSMLVQCAGIYAITSDRDRRALLRAGLVVGAASAITAAAMQMLQGELPPLPQALYGPTLRPDRRGGRGVDPAVVRAADLRAAVQRVDRHPAARAVQRKPSAVDPARDEGPRHLQPFPRRREPVRGGGPGDRGQRPVLQGGRVLSRHRQDDEARVLRREPDPRQSARHAVAVDVGADHRLAT